jgi:3-methyladenine DNA glycosylase AlkC
MADKLSDMFNPTWFRLLASQVKKVYPGFDEKGFLKACMKDLDNMSLNQRMRHASVCLKEFKPLHFTETIHLLKKVIVNMPRGYTNLVFPDFVGLYGQGHFDVSMDALAFFTKYGSSEFAIREFLKSDFEKTMKVMRGWAYDEDLHVRRLASEGSRPRLPWSFKLDRVIADPSLTKPILSALKADPELYVRKSVANHLNDISKIDPAYMLKLCATWEAKNPRTAWIIRHASRTLIKKGHQGSLMALNFEKAPKFKLQQAKLSPLKVKIGGKIVFSCHLQSEKKRPQKLAVDYRIHFCRKNGTSIKTFKLKEFDLKPGTGVIIKKEHSLADLSTRRHYPGEHIFELQVNGKVTHRVPFRLLSS